MIIKRKIKKNTIINLKDIYFKKKDIKTSELKILKKFPVRSLIDLSKGQKLKKNYFQNLKIGVVISCRLESTRLPNKAILKVGNISSIQRCINQVKNSNFKDIVLATSSKEKSSILEKISKKNRIGFFKGSDENLVLRNLQVAKKMNYDHIIRVTGDSPLISYELMNSLVADHLMNNSDYTFNENLPLGTRSEVINVSALSEVYSKTRTDRYGEYLSLFFKNNPNFFRINKLNYMTIEKFKNIRINLDYMSDLKFINQLLSFFHNKKLISLKEIFIYLEFFHKNNKFVKSKYYQKKLYRQILGDSKIK
jgi:spore coat polysaccharide biosynthesis protein SpsF (cytidylyltransferase family)